MLLAYGSKGGFKGFPNALSITFANVPALKSNSGLGNPFTVFFIALNIKENATLYRILIVIMNQSIINRKHYQKHKGK